MNQAEEKWTKIQSGLNLELKNTAIKFSKLLDQFSNSCISDASPAAMELQRVSATFHLKIAEYLRDSAAFTLDRFGWKPSEKVTETMQEFYKKTCGSPPVGPD